MIVGLSYHWIVLANSDVEHRYYENLIPLISIRQYA